MNWEVKAHNNGKYSIIESGKAKHWESWIVAEVDHTIQDEANAHLIAAAPDMLEALERISNLHPTNCILIEVQHARAAINKAKGH